MTTINDLPSLPSSEETLDLSRDTAYASTHDIVAGDHVRIQTGPFAFFDGRVWSKTDNNVKVFLRVFGVLIAENFHWTNLKKVG